MNIIGIDIGFGFTKVTNGEREGIFKSIFGDGRQIQFREQFLGSVGTESMLHMDIDGHEYFVGELAELQSDLRSFTLDQDQFVADFTKILAVAALTQVVESNSSVRVVTGLPISYYKRHREQLAAIVKGQHTAEVFDAAGHKTPVATTVTHIRVIPQPFGSLFNALLNESGDVADRRLVAEKVGVIDIGFCTTDYTIADKTRYSEHGSRTSNAGISRAFENIAGQVKEQTGVDVELYRLYDAVSRGSIKVRGQTINLTPMVEAAFDNLASSISSEVDRLWADDWDIDQILVTGGGATALASYLKTRLQGDVILPQEAADSRFSNVHGYWRFGKNSWDRGDPA